MGQAATGLGLIHEIQRSIRPPIGNWCEHWPLPVPASSEDSSAPSINNAQMQTSPYAELGMNGRVKAYQTLVSRLGYGGEQDAASSRSRWYFLHLLRSPLPAKCAHRNPLISRVQSSDRALGAGWSLARNVPCQFADDKFLKEIDASGFANPDQRVFER
jgi:hypothetical protein